MYATVLSQIGVVLVLVACGYGARRLRLLDAGALGALSRLLVDLAFPALIIVNLLATVDRAALAAEWYVPVAALVLMPGGWLLARRFVGPTEAFLVGLPNWIFLPLLIADALYGALGVRTVLLFNAGSQLALWTVGVATLTGHGHPRQLLRNPGLWATGVGIALALLCPALGPIARAPGAATGWGALPGIVLDALRLLGQMAVPLSLCVTGALLGERTIRETLRPSAGLARVLLGRLVILPALCAGLIFGVQAAGLALNPRARLILLLTMAMPVAVSSAVHARRFGGDARLAAQAVAWSTALSLATVPALVWLVT